MINDNRYKHHMNTKRLTFAGADGIPLKNRAVAEPVRIVA